MRETLCRALVVWSVLVFSQAAQAEDGPVCLDLQPRANHKLAEPFPSGRAGNHLGNLPQGDQKLQGIAFHIGEKFIQLGSALLVDMPLNVEGIKVGRSFEKLHMLHGTGYGSSNQPTNPSVVADGTTIGEYKVLYVDGTVESIPIVYGQDVRDWWNWDPTKKTSRGKLAWEGANEATKQFNIGLRVYAGAWQNPHPQLGVERIDYISTNSPCAPFCVAMTIE